MVTADDSVPTGVLPNNGIVIAKNVASGARIQLQCRSGSTDTGVGQLVDVDGNTFTIGNNSGVFTVGKTGGGSGHPGSVQLHNRVGTENLTAADEGVYTPVVYLMRLVVMWMSILECIGMDSVVSIYFSASILVYTSSNVTAYWV